MTYFAMTMVATVGYGDICPFSNIEKITAIFSMLCGVAFFAYVMDSLAWLSDRYAKRMGNDFS